MSEQKTFDEKYIHVINEMTDYLIDEKLTNIGLTLKFGNQEWEFKLGKVIDRFSEDHPYCKKLCDNCGYGTHSQCDQPEKCHDTDQLHHWVDLD